MMNCLIFCTTIILSNIFLIYCNPDLIHIAPGSSASSSSSDESMHSGHDYYPFMDILPGLLNDQSSPKDFKYGYSICWSLESNDIGLCKKPRCCIRSGGRPTQSINCRRARVCCVYMTNPTTTVATTTTSTTRAPIIPTTATTNKPTTPKTTTSKPIITSTSRPTTTTSTTTTTTSSAPTTTTTTTTTSTTTRNPSDVTQQIVNPKYPAAYIEGGTFSYKITKSSPKHCQILLEFNQLNLAEADATNGFCIYDLLVISNGAQYFPRICGENSGQTMFIDFFKNDPILINIELSSQIEIERKWNIQVTQLTCDFPV